MGEIDYRIPLSIRPVQPQVQPMSASEMAGLQIAGRRMRASEMANQLAAQKQAQQQTQQAQQAAQEAQQQFADSSAIVLRNVLSKRTPLATAQARLAQLAPTPEHQAWVASLTPENLEAEVASIPVSREMMQTDPAYRAQVASREAAARRLTPAQEAERARVKAEAVQPLMERRAALRGAIGATRAAESAKEVELGKIAREGQRPIAQALGARARNFINQETGKAISRSTKVQDAFTARNVVELDTPSRRQLDKIQGTVPVLAQIRQDIEKIYGPGGAFEGLGPEGRLPAAVDSFISRIAQNKPELTQTVRRIESNIDLLRRNFQGQVGTQTEGDARRGLAGMPQIGLIPDTQEVAFGMLNTLIDAVNSSMGTLLDNPQFVDERLQRLQVPSGGEQRTPRAQGPATPVATPEVPQGMRPGETRTLPGGGTIRRIN